MDADYKPHSWPVRWVHAHWPVWAKYVVIGSGIFAWIGTFMGWGGWIVNSIHSHDIKVQAQALAAQLDKQRDIRVDQTLEDHTKDIKETKAGVQRIESTQSIQNVERLGDKGQLDRIETAIINGNRPSISTSPP
jgi:hypothetical protein